MDAFNKIKNFLNQAPENSVPKSILEHAIETMLAGETEKAIEMFQRLVASDSQNWNLHNYLGNCFNALDDRQAAIKAYSQAINLHPTEAHPWANRARVYYDDGQTSLAVNDVKHILHHFQHSARSHETHAKLLMAMDRHDDAIQAFRNALSCDLDGDYEIVFDALKCFHSAGEIHLATEVINHFAHHFSNVARMQYFLGYHLAEIGDFRGASDAYRASQQLDPQDVRSYHARGNVLRKLGEDELAERDYTIAIEMDPHNEWLYLERGRLLYDSEDYNLAIVDLEQMMSINPEFVVGFEYIAGCYQAMGQHEKAIHYFERYEKAHEATTDMLEDRLISYRALGMREQADRDEKAIAKVYRDKFRDVAKSGKLVKTVLVQANNQLFKEGNDRLPALVLLTFDKDLQRDRRAFKEMAERLFSFKDMDVTDPELGRLVKITRDEAARENKRIKLPENFTGGRIVYAVSLFFYRPFMRHGRITSDERFFDCVAETGDEGRIELVPFDVMDKRMRGHDRR